MGGDSFGGSRFADRHLAGRCSGFVGIAGAGQDPGSRVDLLRPERGSTQSEKSIRPVELKTPPCTWQKKVNFQKIKLGL